ncbi:hypothetical protein LQU94_01480 [Peptoniphilus sp. KCTC 25270]|uniref:hypothetical protein n=1 Tax=Peptoniphilus sp. KCTC 25270 TaxID=2897414 RepID=UPI001E47202B|nr:hypothetical protein [Peptoniphilus sp. KCTC 25270]MCD1146785.1 hypothetical protein [Peptoniphilus sp. KCTC 25270]
MLESSIVIRAGLWILLVLNGWYEGSFLHRIFQGIGKGISRALEGSKLIHGILNLDYYLKNTITYKLIRGIFRLINTIIVWIRDRLSRVIYGSALFQTLDAVGKLSSGLSILGLSFLGFGFGLLVILVITKRIQGMIGLVFILLGTISFLLSENARGKLKSSLLIRCVEFFGTVCLKDEEAESWKQ